MNRCVLFLLILIPETLPVRAQQDSSFVQDALYGRPFITSIGRTAVGGYVEGNTNYFVEDGLTDGFSMELRRFNVFLFSNISRRLTLISELEFEHGTEEIALETALIDFHIAPELVLRGGILLPPIGAYNQNHDSPLWEFVDRPLVATEIIPSTLSEVGFGAHGKIFRGGLGFTYDVYLTNGLGDGVILNQAGRTHLASGKRGGQFEEDNNGLPALSGRLATQYGSLGELGLSIYTGIYNTHRQEGDRLEEKRRLTIWALDFNGSYGNVRVIGEATLASIDVPQDLAELFGSKQWGGHLDVIAPVLHLRVLDYENAVLNANLRLEYVDFNAGSFASTGRNIYDHESAISAGFSFRPTSETVFKSVYRLSRSRDLVGNAAVVTSGFQVGFATYF